MSRSSGIQVLSESIAVGPTASRGSTVRYSARFYLRRGDEVTPDFEAIDRYGDRVPTRSVEGAKLIEHSTTLGKRQVIAGVERMLVGLSAGSYREAIIPPHLAYGKKGLGALIPPDAMIRAKVWVHDVDAADA
ncbi:MAG: FKBP-type peptidyl-prolyl cis-trans isomerase [Pseudomonadales bacterium]